MIEVQGADQLARLSKQLKDAGNKELQRELGKAINRATKPVKAAIKDSATDNLPSRGGLAARAAKSPLRTRKRTSQKSAGVRIVSVDHTLSLWHLNQGMVRHRINGKPPTEWTVQTIPRGFWDDSANAAAPECRQEIVKAMDEVGRQIVRSV